MDDRDDVQVLWLHQVHDPKAAIDEFADIGALRFRHQTTDLWTRAYVFDRG
ncbi:MAG: hypothetical protein OXP69_12140 [Spirochaetaceae bacterium]|nr:hypothetical protein [Spirochaetaceae bacterium]